MPNWVTNKITFNGNEKDILKLRKFVTSEERNFDFNKITPMPEELNLVSGSDETIARDCAKARREGKTTCKEFERGWSRGRSFDEWADLGEKYLSNIDKYGASTWYDWCWKHWGTKWNAADSYWESDYTVTFETAWEMPFPILNKLTKLFPNVTFEGVYADEDVGSNCGSFYYDGGSLTANEVNDYEFACDVLGFDPDEFEEEEEAEEDE